MSIYISDLSLRAAPGRSGLGLSVLSGHRRSAYAAVDNQTPCHLSPLLSMQPNFDELVVANFIGTKPSGPLLEATPGSSKRCRQLLCR